MTNEEASEVIKQIHSGTSTIMLNEKSKTIQNNLLHDCEALQIAEDLFQENKKLKLEIERLKSELDQSIKLPCKVGVSLFEADTDANEIKEYTIKNMDEVMIDLVPNKKYISWLTIITSNHIGSLVFLTREEAERALKEKQNK